MKRAVICVTNPQEFIPELADYSLMIVNPATNTAGKVSRSMLEGLYK